MTTLSLAQAALEVPSAPALISADACYTFQSLYQAARSLPDPGPWLMGAADPETFVRIHACLLSGRAPLMLHPRSPEGENRRILAAFGSLLPATFIEPRPETPLAFFLTSGTSGTPKAVVLSRRAFLAAAIAHDQHLGWRPDDRWLLSMPLAHVGGFSILTRCLWARKPVVLISKFNPESFISACHAHQVTIASLVPTMLRRLLQLPRPPSLRMVLLGGAHAPPALISKARQQGWPVVATYGLTEACAQVCTQPLGDTCTDDVGPPLPGISLRIQNGIIQIRGPTLMNGYLGQQPLEDQWFDTGDLGALQNGRLQVFARRQDLIISGGENIYPAEIEALLAAIGIEAVAFGVPDAEWGQQVAVAWAAGHALDESTVLETFRHQLAAHKRPRWTATLPVLPLLASGKVDRALTITQATSRLIPFPPQGNAEYEAP